MPIVRFGSIPQRNLLRQRNWGHRSLVGVVRTDYAGPVLDLFCDIRPLCRILFFFSIFLIRGPPGPMRGASTPQVVGHPTWEEDPVDKLSQILWRERELLDSLLFKLEMEQLVLGSGRTRRL